MEGFPDRVKSIDRGIDLKKQLKETLKRAIVTWYSPLYDSNCIKKHLFFILNTHQYYRKFCNEEIYKRK